MSVKLTLSLLLTAVVVAHTASILDYIKQLESTTKMQIPGQREDQQPNRNCMCKGPACACCIDMNITYVDLGGPGCVHMKYLSPDEGFSVNVSYGKQVIHSSKIRGDNPEPVCLQLLGMFAQMCAKFSDLAPTSDGLRGCLDLEARVINEPQLAFPVGCFRSSNGGMEMEDPKETEENTTEEITNNEEEEDDDVGFDAENFILSMVQTAEQGVAFFSSLLDIPNRRNITAAATTATTTVKPQEVQESTEAEVSQKRSPKYIIHPNLL